MARSRERKRRGLLQIRLDLFEREREGLIAAGLLKPHELNNKKAVGEAMYALLKRIFA